MLDALLDRKGALSRQIGQAKRSNLSIDDLLIEMKQVSQQIKALQADEISEASPLKPSAKELKHISAEAPSLFSASFTQCEMLNSDIVIHHATEADVRLWDEYVHSKSNSSIYHLWEFKSIIESSFGHECRYLMALDKQNDRVVGVIPAVEMNSRLFGHFIVSQPFFTYGSVLADSDVVEQALYEYLIDFAQANHIGHIEFRGSKASSVLDGVLLAKETKVSMVRALPETSDILWDDIGTKVRAQIKKSQRYPLSMKFGKAELLNDFYRVFSENMRDLGTPVYSKRFFSNLINSELSHSFTIGVVYHEGMPAAACFLMSHNAMMEIPWASTLKSMNSMNVNMYMYWEVLSHSIRTKHAFFDFGRSSKDAGTYRFKKQWGAKPFQLYWKYWLPENESMPELNPNNPKYKLMIQVWQKLPVWLTQIIGPPVVKYLP